MDNVIFLHSTTETRGVNRWNTSTMVATVSIPIYQHYRTYIGTMAHLQLVNSKNFDKLATTTNPTLELQNPQTLMPTVYYQERIYP